MTKEERSRLYDRAIDFYLPGNQSLLCAECMAELSGLIVKFERGCQDLGTIEAIADGTSKVLIMLEQIVRMFEIADDVEIYKELNLQRMEKRLGQFTDEK